MLFKRQKPGIGQVPEYTQGHEELEQRHLPWDIHRLLLWRGDAGRNIEKYPAQWNLQESFKPGSWNR